MTYSEGRGDICPAPFCGLRVYRPWVTPVFDPCDYTAFDAMPVLASVTVGRIVTCHRPACIAWAKLRASEKEESAEWIQHQDRMLMQHCRPVRHEGERWVTSAQWWPR